MTTSAMTTHVSSREPTKRRFGEQIIYIRDLLRELILRDLKIRYKRSFLGIAWSLVTPITQVLIFSFVFNKILPLDVENYTAFLFVGVLSWSWFATSLNSSAGAVTHNPGLVRRPGFPVAVLPVLTVASSGIHFLLALPILFIFTVTGGGTPGAALVALPLVMCVQFFITLSLAYLIAAGNVRYRDIQHLVGSLLMVAFYLTPVFYSARAVPEDYRFVYTSNPMAEVLAAYRAILIENRWPDFDALLWVSGFATILLSGSYWLFRRASVRFAEEL
jgi:lipopolysaccharide transport system permease protein